MQTESVSGDFDIVIMGNHDKLEQVYANRNFYIDDLEFFSAQSLDKHETRERMDQRAIKSRIPFVNFTLIQETLDDYYGKVE
jgi:calcineurin-like phosphoesterase family protein